MRFIEGCYYEARYTSTNIFIGRSMGGAHMQVMSRNGQEYTSRGTFSKATDVRQVSERYAMSYGKLPPDTNSNAQMYLDTDY